METRVLKVDGMSCDHCKMAVTKALKGIEGVADASVDLERGEATVRFDPARVSLQALRNAVEEAGYELVV